MPSSSYSNEIIASLYDPVYSTEEHLSPAPGSDTPRDAVVYLERLGAAPKRVLELGAGTGRVSIPLAAAGHAVTGLDASREMLDVAESKATRLSDDVRRRLTWVHGDWHDYDLGPPPFDAAVCPFSSFLMNVTIADQDRFLSLAWKHLAPGGLLMIDMFFPDLERLAKAREPRHKKRSFVVDGVEWTEHERITRVAASQSFECVLDYERADGIGTRLEQVLHLTWFLPRELERVVAANGFELVEIVDPGTGDSVRDGSRRQVVVATRPDAGT